MKHREENYTIPQEEKSKQMFVTATFKLFKLSSKFHRLQTQTFPLQFMWSLSLSSSDLCVIRHQCGSKLFSPDSWSDLIFLQLWLENSLIVSFKSPILVTQLEVSINPAYLNNSVIKITGSYLWLFTSFIQLDHNPACHRFVCPISQRIFLFQEKVEILHSDFPWRTAGLIFFLIYEYGLYSYFSLLRYELLYVYFKPT